jgi:glucan biosynthesis protein
MKLALLIQAPAKVIKESHVSFLGAGKFRIVSSGSDTKLAARVNNIEQGVEEIVNGPCYISIIVKEPTEERISVYAEKVA